MKSIFRIIVVVAFLVLSDRVILADTFEAGFARVEITPPVGMRLCGSFSEKISIGVHDPLFVRASVFRQGNITVALAGCDLAMVFPHIGDEVRKLVGRELGIASEAVLIHASETHNGPDYFGEFRDVFHQRALTEHGRDPAEPIAYEALLIEGIAQAIREAHWLLAPHGVGFAESEKAGLAFHRRFRMRDGSVGWNPGKLNPDIVAPLGPVDARVPVLSFTPQGASLSKPSALFTGFALHLAILNDREYSADYPYYLERRIKKILGEEAFVHFLRAPCCEVNHIDVSQPRPQKGHVYAREVGNQLADTVLASLEAVTPLVPDLRVASKIVDLSLQSFSQAETDQARELWHDPDRGDRPFLDVVRAGKIAAIQDRRKGGAVPVLVQAIALDAETVLLGLPSEVSVEFGLALREHSPFEHTIVVQLSNDWLGYIPPRRVFADGHYEAEVAKILPGEGERLVEEALELLLRLQSEPRPRL